LLGRKNFGLIEETYGFFIIYVKTPVWFHAYYELTFVTLLYPEWYESPHKDVPINPPYDINVLLTVRIAPLWITVSPNRMVSM